MPQILLNTEYRNIVRTLETKFEYENGIRDDAKMNKDLYQIFKIRF